MEYRTIKDIKSDTIFQSLRLSRNPFYAPAGIKTNYIFIVLSFRQSIKCKYVKLIWYAFRHFISMIWLTSYEFIGRAWKLKLFRHAISTIYFSSAVFAWLDWNEKINRQITVKYEATFPYLMHSKSEKKPQQKHTSII